MLGATLRVKSRVADLCRPNSSVSTLVLDTNGWFIDAMFISHEGGWSTHSVSGDMWSPVAGTWNS
jgi:hypothetical protein